MKYVSLSRVRRNLLLSGSSIACHRVRRVCFGANDTAPRRAGCHRAAVFSKPRASDPRRPRN